MELRKLRFVKVSVDQACGYCANSTIYFKILGYVGVMQRKEKREERGKYGIHRF